MIKVGDTLYEFNINRRVYKGTGINAGGPIYAEHFRPHVIVEETKQSWIVGPYSQKIKISKSGMKSSNGRYSPSRWYTKEGMEEDIWRHEHLYKLEACLKSASVAQLKEIAKILGYES